MRQIVYFSTASGRQDAIVAADILVISRERNRREKVSGLLVAGGHRYLQVIEGPADVVHATMARIRRDRRHLGMAVLVDRKIAGPSFSGWSMAYCEEPKFGEFATLQQLIDQMRDHVGNAKLSDQLDYFARSFAVAPLDHVAVPWTLATHYDPALALDRSH